MKRGFNILMIVCVALSILSCSKTKSYTDMLKDERKAIERLIDDEGIKLLGEFPKDSVFQDNEFFKLSNEVYINIVDLGGANKAVSGKTEVLARFDASYFMDDTTRISNYGPNSNGLYPMEFKYGHSTASGYASYLISEGLQTGLQYVGHKGKVKLIIPFKRGSSTDMQGGDPVYIRIIEYKFVDEL